MLCIYNIFSESLEKKLYLVLTIEYNYFRLLEFSVLHFEVGINFTSRRVYFVLDCSVTVIDYYFHETVWSVS